MEFQRLKHFFHPEVSDVCGLYCGNDHPYYNPRTLLMNAQNSNGKSCVDFTYDITFWTFTIALYALIFVLTLAVILYLYYSIYLLFADLFVWS